MFGSLLPALAVLPFSFMLGLSLLRFAQGADRARAVVDAYLAWVLVSQASAELFGYFQRIAFLPFLIVWGTANFWVILELWPLRQRALSFWRGQVSLPGLIVAACLLTTLFIALTAAPSDWDSQIYHLPRIEHWIQNGSLEFYPTSIRQQNETGPLAEVLLLQTRILGGSDALYLLVQWASMLCSLAAVLRITRQLGGSKTQSWLAVVVLATLPIGIVESTSTRNDYVVAALLACGVTLGLEALASPRSSLALVVAAGAAIGLSGLANPVGFLLGSGFALWFVIGLSRRVPFSTWLIGAVAVAAVLALILGPFALRFLARRQGGPGDLASFAISGSFDVAYDDNFAISIHLMLVLAAVTITGIRWRTAAPHRRAYLGAWLLGVIAFAAVLRFGIWMTRDHLPAFALAAPLVALAWPERWAAGRKAAILLLGLTALPALFFNQGRELVPLWRNRPLAIDRDRPSYLGQSRDERLFADQPSLLAPYRDAVEVIERSQASQVGLVLGGDSWEYPLWRMLRDRSPDRLLRIEHVDLPGEPRWPLGPFVPDLLFWNHEEAPPTIEIEGRQFTRLGPPGTIAVYVRVGVAVK